MYTCIHMYIYVNALEKERGKGKGGEDLETRRH